MKKRDRGASREREEHIEDEAYLEYGKTNPFPLSEEAGAEGRPKDGKRKKLAVKEQGETTEQAKRYIAPWNAEAEVSVRQYCCGNATNPEDECGKCGRHRCKYCGECGCEGKATPAGREPPKKT